MKGIQELVTSFVTRYNDKTFWARYMACQNKECHGLRRLYYIFYIKRVISKHCCDLMVTLSGRENFGAFFSAPHIVRMV